MNSVQVSDPTQLVGECIIVRFGGQNREYGYDIVRVVGCPEYTPLTDAQIRGQLGIVMPEDLSLSKASESIH